MNIELITLKECAFDCTLFYLYCLIIQPDEAFFLNDDDNNDLTRTVFSLLPLFLLLCVEIEFQPTSSLSERRKKSPPN